MKFISKLLPLLVLVILFAPSNVLAVTGTTKTAPANSSCTGNPDGGTYSTLQALINDHPDYNTADTYCVSYSYTKDCTTGNSTGVAYQLHYTPAFNQVGAPQCLDGVSSVALTNAITYVNPTVALSAAPSTIQDGDTAKLSWTTNDVDASSCTSSDIPNFGRTSGYSIVSPNQTTTYHITCPGVANPASAQIIVQQPLSDSISCTVTNPPSSPTINSPVTWTATLGGSSGVSPFIYNWFGDNLAYTSASTSSRTNSTSVTYTTGGQKKANVSVSDSSGTAASGPQSTSNTSYSCNTSLTPIAVEQDVEDGGTFAMAENTARNEAGSAITDPSFAPADFQQNPQNYCVQAYVQQPCYTNPNNTEFGSGSCPNRITIALYKSSAITNTDPANSDSSNLFAASKEYWHPRWWTAITYASVPGTQPGSASTMCTVTLNGRPTPPIITTGAAPGVACSASSPANAKTNTTVTFNISGSDPDGDNVKYGYEYDATSSPTWTTASTSGWTFTTTKKWTTAGSYILYAESQDTHNNISDWSYCPITISNGTLPNLTASDVTPTGATAGTAVSLSAVISDATAMSGKPYTDLFQSSPNSDGSASSDLGTYANASTTANATTNATLSHTFSAGTYYLRACADKSSAGDTGVITESNENDNCSPDWIQFTVCPSNQTWNGTACVVANAPSCNFNPSSYTLSGGSATLQWTSQNAASCTSSNIPRFPGGTSGSVNVTQAMNGYAVTCSDGSGNSGSCTTDVSGGSVPCTQTQVTLLGAPLGGTPVPGPIRVEASTGANNVTLTWGNISTTAASCAITRSDTGATVKTITPNQCTASGNSVNVPVSTQTKFTLTCEANNTASVVVNIIPAFQEF